MTTTTRLDQRARGDVGTSHATAPARTVSGGGVDFAYRELGPAVFQLHEQFVERALAFLGTGQS